ncbi:MAG: hypothetical protein FWE67_00710, partial [Planctomycetaceae bacterium]|nr:hypothetical protein [Planctomycetaceae bacterium]
MNNYISCLVLLFVLAVGINAQADIDIDQLVLCSVLTQEERDILKRYPVIVEALAVVNRTPRYTQGSLFRNRVHSLKNITLSLLDIGDKEAAKVALRLTHKKFVDMPFMLQTDSFFKQLNRFYDHGEGRRSILSADDFYPQEFFDDLIARCSDDFSDKIYDGHYETGASRFREALRGVIYGMGVNPGRPYAPGSELEALKRKTGTLERGLNFITRIPDNKTCEGMRKELFLQLFRYIPLEMTTGFVDALAEPEIKKEFTAYLMEVGEQQKREDIYRNQTGHGNLRFGETPSREELQTLVDTTKNVFDRCEAMLALAMYDLKHGNIEQAVKQARELEKIFASVERPWQMGRTEMFFSELATALFKEGKYENGINYLLEGAGNFCAEHFADWSSTSSGETFILPPLQELYTAIRKDRTRDIIRKKLQVSLQSAKDFQTTAQSQQLRAILEMQI